MKRFLKPAVLCLTAILFLSGIFPSEAGQKRLPHIRVRKWISSFSTIPIPIWTAFLL